MNSWYAALIDGLTRHGCGVVHAPAPFTVKDYYLRAFDWSAFVAFGAL